MKKWKIFVFKTDVDSAFQAEQLCRQLEQQPDTRRATVDLEDCDRVLRIESAGRSTRPILKTVRKMGIAVEELL